MRRSCTMAPNTSANGVSAAVSSVRWGRYHDATMRSRNVIARSLRGGLRRERDVHEARGARGLHDVNDRLMRGVRIGVDDHHGVLGIAGRTTQLVGEGRHGAEREHR